MRLAAIPDEFRDEVAPVEQAITRLQRRTTVVWETNTTNGFAVKWGTAVIWGTDQPFPGLVAVRGRSLMWLVG